MKIVVDENKKIIAYALIGDLENAIEIENFNFDNSKIDKYYYLNGDILLLEDGQYIKDNQIVTVEKPHEEIEYIWDDTNNLWKLKYTKEELQQAKTNLILEHNKKRKEIVALNEEAEFFDVSESVTKANDELEEIRAKITEIDKVIEEMNKQQ